MDDGLDGVKARLRAPLASVEVPDSDERRATNSSTDFPLLSSLREGYVAIEAVGEAFWKHADFEGSPVLQTGSVDPSWTDRLDFTLVNEDSLKTGWIEHVKIPVWTYLELLGSPAHLATNCRIDSLPEWKG